MNRIQFNISSLRCMLFLFFALSCFSVANAQPIHSFIEVMVTPDRLDWTYELDERADFEIKVLRNGQLQAGIKASYEIGPEQMPAWKKGDIWLEHGEREEANEWLFENLKLNKKN